MVLLLLLGLQDASAIDAAVKSVAGMDVRKWKLVDDAEFLARVTRDLWGEAPADAKPFVEDKAPDKRARKIDELLASPKFAAFWGRRLATWLIGESAAYTVQVDGLKVQAERAIADAFVEWMIQGVAMDRPWTETVTAIVDARGEAVEVPALAWKLGFAGRPRPALEGAVDLAHRLLGIRLHCATCHDHPYDRWRLEDAYGLAAFLVRDRVRMSADGKKVEWKVSDDGEMQLPNAAASVDAKVKLPRGETVAPVFLFGGAAGKNDDRPKVLAALLTSKANTQLPRALANRIWAELFGKGIVHPPDDFNLRNKASSPLLLDALTRCFIGGGTRLRPLLRTICSSEIYQNVETTDPAKADGSSFRGLIVKSPDAHPKPFGMLKLSLPAEWTQRLGSLPVTYRVPDKEGQAGPARFGPYNDGGDSWLNQVVGGKPVVEKFDGPVQVTVTDVAGTYTCDPTSAGPREKWRILVARVKAEKTSRVFRLEGPADTVGDWRDAFVELLRKAEIR